MTTRAVPTAKVIPLPLARRKLAEASIVPLAREVTALVFDTPPEAGSRRPRLTALRGGQPLGGASLATSLELRSGGRRHVLLAGLGTEALTGTTVTLALGAQLAAILDGDWLQPPIGDGTGLVRGLSEAGRQRLLKLLLTTGASLFGRGAPDFAEAARRIVDVAAAPALTPAAWCPLGTAGRIVSYRAPEGMAPDAADSLVAVSRDGVARLLGWQMRLEAGKRGDILHLYLPGPLPAGAALVGLGRTQLHLRAPQAALAAQPLVPWLGRRSPGVRDWADALLAAAAPADPVAAAQARELSQGEEAAPRASLGHLSATPGGLLYGLDLADPSDLVRALRLERGAATVEVAVRAGQPPAGFAALPAPEGRDRCRLALVHRSGRVTTLFHGTPDPFGGAVPAALAGHPDLVARARLDLPRVRATGVGVFGAPAAEPLLSIVAPVAEPLDLIAARAALAFGEPKGRGVELVYHVRHGALAEAARVAVARAEAVYGLPHRLVVLPAAASDADGLLAALAEAQAPRLLCLGAEVLPAGPGWLAPWLLRLDAARPILGGLLLGIDGSAVHAGGCVGPAGTELRGAGWPARDLPRSASATDLVTAACVGLTRGAADRLAEEAPHYPEPDVMLAHGVQALRQAGGEARTLLSCRFVRYGGGPRRDPAGAAVDAQALAAVLKPFFRIAAEEGEP